MLSSDGILSALDDSEDRYFSWLSNQLFPSQSYQNHPLNSREEICYYEQVFAKQFQISLKTFIQLKRVFFILNNASGGHKNNLLYSFIETPLGLMVAVFSEKGLCLLEFLDKKSLETELYELMQNFQANLVFQESRFHTLLQEQLAAYFSGRLEVFDLPLSLVGTDFQIGVWQTLLRVTYGKVLSYSEQAVMGGVSTAVRAVASANGKNKIAIVVPCHRVLRKDFSLGGYSSGVARKAFLLSLEGVTLFKSV